METYGDVVKKQKGKMLALSVRKTDSSRIMIEGDKESLLYLSEYLKRHACGDTCYIDVPLKVNLISGKLDDNDFELFLHRLPCDEDC
ncbi:MAG: hypothetical protein COA45_05460 [Zetaproteobacteria bacterium]|nr:MAG: hypothetical protein COA45_05460 [Zetaproteobacteria bacterium]